MNYKEMLSAGVPILPCVPKNKLPARTRGTFTVKGGFDGWVRTQEQFDSETPTTCWAVNPGNGGWMVIDIDTKEGKDGLNNLRKFLEAIGDTSGMIDQLTARTFPAMVVTPSGGFHAYFKFSGAERYRKSYLAKGCKDVELFHGVGYVMAPGSFIKGYGTELYVFYGDMANAPDAPEWLVGRFVENEKAKIYQQGAKKRFRGRRFNAKLVWADLNQRREKGSIDGMNLQLYIFASAASEGNANPAEVEDFLVNEGIDIGNHKIQYALRNLYISGSGEDDEETPFTALSDIDMSEMSDAEREKVMKKKELYEKKQAAKEIKDAEASQKSAEREMRFKKLVDISKKALENWRYIEGQKSFADIAKRSILLDKEQMDDRFSCDVRDCTGEDKTFTYLMRYYPETIKSVDNIQYWPGQEPIFKDGGKTYLNRWEPSSLKAEKGDVQWFIDHLLYIYDGNYSYVENFLNWAAHIIQEPSEICVWNPWIQSSVEGTGKSMIANIMRKLVGEENSTVITATDIASDYNGWASRKLVIIEEMDEAKSWGTLADKLKHLATSDKIRINDKYVKPFDANNCLQFMLLSNKEVPMKITNDARRWFIHKMQAGIKAEAYYEKMGWHIANDCGHVLHFLKERDLSKQDFNPKRLKLDTDSKAEILHASKSDQHKAVETKVFELIEEKTNEGIDPMFLITDEFLDIINTGAGFTKDRISEAFAGGILCSMRDDKNKLMFTRDRIKIKGTPRTVYMFGITKEIYLKETDDDYTVEMRAENKELIRAGIREKLSQEIKDEFETPKQKKAQVIPIHYKLSEQLRKTIEASFDNKDTENEVMAANVL